MSPWGSRLLRMAVALIGGNAVLGVAILLRGDMGPTEGKILVSSLFATAGAIGAMTCAPAREQGRLGWIPEIGIVTSLAAAALFVVAAWLEFEPVPLVKTAGSLAVLALAAALASVLSGWPLGGHWSWLLPAAEISAAAAALLAIVGIWGEVDDEIYWRGFGALVVIVAGTSLAIPVLHRIQDGGEALEDVLHCPFCGGSVEVAVGARHTCPYCGTAFRVSGGTREG